MKRIVFLLAMLVMATTVLTAQVASTLQAYWTIQGSQNGIGLALHF